jgi:hypothetical protein
MVVKRKVSLGGGDAPKGAVAAPSQETLDLFFNTGVVFHEVKLAGELPDVVSSFVVMKAQGATAPAATQASVTGVRRANPGEEADVEVSALEHIGELSGRWLPVPYQLSCLFAVQVFLGGGDPRSPRILLAIDTVERKASGGRHLDASLDEGRPFRPLDRGELAVFLDHGNTRDLLRKLERGGLDRAPFKIAALLETLLPALPRIRFSRVEPHATVGVSLVVDLGNSRSTAALVESREKGLFSIPLEVRSSLDPFSVSEDTFDSRVTFLPPPFDEAVSTVCVGDSFALPSIVRMGREALDRALETPHRYACTISGPKRYLWDGRPGADKWHFAAKQDGEYKPIFGRILKHVSEEPGGLGLRADGPSAPADPRYPPRTMMMFAMVEILSLAIAQINSPRYRTFQGKEGSPRVLKNLVLTYPSGMQAEERRVYEALVRNAVLLASHLLNLPEAHRPNWVPAQAQAQAQTQAQAGTFEPFLFVDEALAAQMVYVYQEVAESFAGSMEDLIGVYGRSKTKLRIGSIDIGGGTSDVMIAEYEDKLPGAGTALAVTKLFQDGVSIAGDEVCRAILEDIVFAQLLAQLPSPDARAKVVHMFGDGDGGHGAAWRTLKAKLVPYFWLPLSRAYWSVAEGYQIPGHAPDKLYSVPDIMRLFPAGSWSEAVVAEADKLLGSVAKDFPGIMNLFFRFDREEAERTALGVLREPLRKYADILAQFDVDLIVLAGKTSALPCVYDLFVAELAVAPPRIRRMSSYKVGDWYPSKWREAGFIKDPKSTVTAGATILHMAAKNRLPGFLLDRVETVPMRPIYGLYQETEPHIPRQNELFRAGGAKKAGKTSSPPFAYTRGMTIGFRNVDSPEMDASPLFEVLPRTADVEQALLEDRVTLSFGLSDDDRVSIDEVTSQRGVYTFGPDDFVLSLRTLTEGRYWLDTGVFKDILKYV